MSRRPRTNTPTRREFLRTAALSTAALSAGSPARAAPAIPTRETGGQSGRVDHIPVRWVEPKQPRSGTNVAIWLPFLGGSKDTVVPYLRDLASAGFLAVSFDPWQHGERSDEAEDALLKRVFGNFRRHMWPILGQTALDTVRVIDWLTSTFPTSKRVHVGGLSMGGDISVAAAGLDGRISAVAAIVATPDWLRPGMRDLYEPNRLLPPGTPDRYASYFYEAFDPMTHLGHYRRDQAITFECAAEDTHVPPEGATRFREALRSRRGATAVRVTLHPRLGHRDLGDPVFWRACLEWFKAH